MNEAELLLLLQKLEEARQAQNHETERSLLDELGNHYFSIGLYQEALTCYEQKLAIDREQENRHGEATTLNDMALVYDELGEPQRALALLNEALPIVRTIGDRAGEANTLNDMALVYQDIAEPQAALDLLEQALIIRRDDGDRAAQAMTLNNIAGIYHAIGEPYRALSFFKQAYPIFQQLKHRAGEAATLNNMALVHRNIGEPQRAFILLQQTLPIRREVGDPVEEASTLTSMASVLMDLGCYADALEAFEQAIAIEREAQHRAGEAAALVGAARLLYRHLNRQEDAKAYMQQAIEVLEAGQLSHDIAGHTTDMLKQVQATMQRNEELGTLQDEAETLSSTQIQQIVGNTIAVMTVAQDQRAEWHTSMAGALQHAEQQGEQWQQEAAFFKTVLEILEGKTPRLPETHPYAAPVAEMNRGIRAGRARVVAPNEEQRESPDEAQTLNSMAQVYQESGQHQKAIDLHQKALAIYLKNSDRVGEANTLAHLAEVYHASGEPYRAFDLYQQSLAIYQEQQHHNGEAAILSQMALIHRNTGQPHHALELYEQALPLCQQMDDRASEAGILNGMASVLMDLGRYSEALPAFEQCAEIEQQRGNYAGEAAGLIGAARLLYRHLNRQEDAIAIMDRAIDMLEKTGLSQDAAGHTTAMLKHVASMMRRREDMDMMAQGASKMSQDQMQQMISNTILVMTVAQDKRAEWRSSMQGALQQAQQRGENWQPEVEFFETMLAMLDGQSPQLPPKHPYAATVAEIAQGMQTSQRSEQTPPDGEVARAVEDYVSASDMQTRRQVLEAQQMLLFRPGAETLLEQKIAQAGMAGNVQEAHQLQELLTLLQECESQGIAQAFAARDRLPCEPPVPELAERAVQALQGDAETKMAFASYLANLDEQTQDEQMKRLLHALNMALFGADIHSLGTELSGPCREVWEQVVAGAS